MGKRRGLWERKRGAEKRGRDAERRIGQGDKKREKRQDIAQGEGVGEGGRENFKKGEKGSGKAERS